MFHTNALLMRTARSAGGKSRWWLLAHRCSKPSFDMGVSLGTIGSLNKQSPLGLVLSVCLSRVKPQSYHDVLVAYEIRGFW
jgi:hypothetical protein